MKNIYLVWMQKSRHIWSKHHECERNGPSWINMENMLQNEQLKLGL